MRHRSILDLSILRRHLALFNSHTGRHDPKIPVEGSASDEIRMTEAFGVIQYRNYQGRYAKQADLVRARHLDLQRRSMKASVATNERGDSRDSPHTP